MGWLTNDEGESRIFDIASATIQGLWSLMPDRLGVPLSIGTDAIFSISGQFSDRDVGATTRDAFQVIGGVGAGAVFGFTISTTSVSATLVGLGVVSVASAPIAAIVVVGAVGVGVGAAGEWLSGSIYDLMFDHGSQPLIPHSEMQGINMYAAEGFYGWSDDSPPPLPIPNRTRPSDGAIQLSRDIVAGRQTDSSGQKIYPDAILRGVAAIKTQFEKIAAQMQAMAAAQAHGAI